jgi:hypothetical protein
VRRETYGSAVTRLALTQERQRPPGPPGGAAPDAACNRQQIGMEEFCMGIVSKAGTKAVKKTVKNEVGDVADKMVDKGPVDKMEDKLDDKKDKMIRKGIKNTVL